MANEYVLRLPQAKLEMLPFGVPARKGNKAAWPILVGVSIAQVEIPAGAWRGPHYHSNTPELAVIVHGTARAGLVTPLNEVFEMDLATGDCVYFPMGWTHWLRNTGNVSVQTYFNYGHEQPETLEVAENTVPRL